MNLKRIDEMEFCENNCVCMYVFNVFFFRSLKRFKEVIFLFFIGRLGLVSIREKVR